VNEALSPDPFDVPTAPVPRHVAPPSSVRSTADARSGRHAASEAFDDGGRFEPVAGGFASAAFGSADGRFDDPTRAISPEPAPAPKGLRGLLQDMSPRTMGLAAFAVVGFLALAGVGAFAMSKVDGTSSSTAFATTTETSLAASPALTTTASPSSTPVGQPAVPPAPAVSTTAPATTTSAASPPPPPPPAPVAATGNVSGTVGAKNSMAWTINTARGPVQVAINASTTFNQASGRDPHFAVGTPVSVTGQNFGGTLLAQAITEAPLPQDQTTTTDNSQAGGQQQDGYQGQQGQSQQGQGQNPYGQGQQGGQNPFNQYPNQQQNGNGN
jgi:hypothetical protein